MKGKKEMTKKEDEMKKLLKKLTIYTALAAMVASTSLAYAMPMEEEHAGEKSGKGGEKGEKFQAIMEKLDLTQEQKDQLKEHREARQEETKELKEELKANRKTLHEELKKYDSDRGVIAATLSKVNDLQGKLMQEKTESFLQMKEILTPEQFQKMSELKDAQRAKKGKKGKGDGSGPRKGPKKDF